MFQELNNKLWGDGRDEWRTTGFLRLVSKSALPGDFYSEITHGCVCRRGQIQQIMSSFWFIFQSIIFQSIKGEKMLCTLWPLIPVGKSWWTIVSCKLNLGLHPSFAPCQNVTVELSNYGVKPLWELVGFQALDVFIKMRSEAFLQVSIFAMYKLLGLLQGEINESPWSVL